MIFGPDEAEIDRLRRVESCARSLLAEHRDDPGGMGEETLFDVLAETLGIIEGGKK